MLKSPKLQNVQNVKKMRTCANGPNVFFGVRQGYRNFATLWCLFSCFFPVRAEINKCPRIRGTSREGSPPPSISNPVFINLGRCLYLVIRGESCTYGFWMIFVLSEFGWIQYLSWNRFVVCSTWENRLAGLRLWSTGFVWILSLFRFLLCCPFRRFRIFYLITFWPFVVPVRMLKLQC